MTLSIDAFVRTGHPRLILRYPALTSAQAVLVPHAVYEAAWPAFVDHCEGEKLGHRLPFPVSSRPLADKCAIYVEVEEGADMARLFVLERVTSGEIVAQIFDRKQLRECGRYTPGKASWSAAEGYGLVVVLVAYIVAFCNAADFVEGVPAGDRSFRRQLAKAAGDQSPEPVLYRWRAQRSATSAGETAGERHLPLHWRRGHWRKAQSHFAGAVDLSADAVSKRSGWHVWIDGTWVGDPAHGVRRKLYTPPISDFFGASAEQV